MATSLRDRALHAARRIPGRRRLHAFSQLRVRVLAGVLLVILVALAVFDVAAVTALRGYLLGQTDGQLGAVAGLYRPVTIDLASPPAAFWQRIHGTAAPRRQVVLQGPRAQLPAPVLDQFWAACLSCLRSASVLVGGDPGLRPKLPGDLVAIARARRALTVAGGGNAPLRLTARREAGGILVVTTSLSDVNQTVGHLELILAVGSAAAAALAGLGTAWIARRGLRPVEQMAAQADGITLGDLTHRVGPHDPRTEVGRLGTALNGMLARLEAEVAEREASQELMRQFFADASHELRNPLASLRANAELYQQGALARRSEVDEAMRRIGSEARRMSGLVDSMLRLARLDQHPDREHEPVDLSALAADCAERAMISDPGRQWAADIAPGLVVTGDEELLRQAIDNLLANVRAHTPPGTPASISAAARGGCAQIEVRDAGPGVPASELPRIFDRFYRAGTPSRSGPGSGLGLAIVSAVAAAHDGRARAALAEPAGLRVTLTLPAGDPVPAAVT
jgi:two-component system OmpR family sensor kinase